MNIDLFSVFFLFAFLFLLAGNLIKYKTILHPITLVHALWILGCFFYIFIPGLKPISNTGFLWILVSFCFISLGGNFNHFILRFFYRKLETLLTSPSTKFSAEKFDKYLECFFVSISILGAFFYLFDYLSILFEMGYAEFFFKARTLSIQGESIVPTKGYLMKNTPSLLMLCSVHTFVRSIRNDSRFLKFVTGTLILISLIVGSIEGARTGGFVILLVITFIGMNASKKKLVFFVKCFLILFVFYSILAFVSNKGLSPDKSIKENIQSLSKTVFLYAFGGIKSFDYTVNNSVNPDRIISLEWFFKALYARGIDLGIDTSTYYLDFVPINEEGTLGTNVYSFLFVLRNDYGDLGALMILFILGILGGLFHVIKEKSHLGMTLWGFFMMAMSLSIFSEYTIYLFNIWIRFIVFYILIFKIRPLERFFLFFSKAKVFIKKSHLISEEQNEVETF